MFRFNDNLLNDIRRKFHQVEEDYSGRKRIFFENSGGSLRLKSAVGVKAELEMIAECPERTNDVAVYLQDIKNQGINDLKKVIFRGDESGSIVSELTASQVMFRISRAIIENVPGKNVVTTSLEHPSAYDSAKMYAEKMGMELRVAKANSRTGGVDTSEIIKLVDKNTCLLSVMSASNISGYIFDLEEIVEEARKIKPDLYIITDAVQHLPHSTVDTKTLNLDGINYGPYKHFGIRGCGFGYVSERVANLLHDKLEAKPSNEWELGTYTPANFAAITKVVDYVCWIGSHYSDTQKRDEQYLVGMDKIHSYEHTLLVHMLDGTDEVPGLRNIPGVKVYFDLGNDCVRDLIAPIGIKGLGYSKAVKEYYKRGITVFDRVNTSLYSKRIVESIGLTGAIRVSPIHCNTIEEVNEFLRVTKEIVESVRG